MFLSGKVVNIRDAYKHPNFFKDVDKNTGFHTRNILCFPIKVNQDVMGVAQLCNKIGGIEIILTVCVCVWMCGSVGVGLVGGWVCMCACVLVLSGCACHYFSYIHSHRVVSYKLKHYCAYLT